MDTIGFLSPYKHLKEFKAYAEAKFNCVDVTKDNITDVDYVFYAPNYAEYILKDLDIDTKRVKAVISPSTGLNHIDVSIPVLSIQKDPILETITSTAEHTIFLILAVNRTVDQPRELSKCTLGILGNGRLGKIMNNIGNTLFKDVKVKDLDYEDDGFYSETDFLSIHIDYSQDNDKIINEEFLKKFKKPIFVINTSRGEVVDEQILVDLIDKNVISGYATDVVTNEHSSEVPFLYRLGHENIVITPHIGGTTVDAQEVAYKRVLDKIVE